ncbi:MAG: sugar ABC transporter ATP-binding protein [Gordonia sp. (in: high G+C Gram-positive bacteria)]
MSDGGANTPALHVEGLSKTFGENTVLTDISLRIEPGSVVALLGENGSGKSTLVKILSGIYPPDRSASSMVSINGVDPYAAPFPPRAARAAGLAVLHQDLGLVEGMTLADNVGLVLGFGQSPAAPVRRARHERQVASILERFGLEGRANILVAELGPTERTLGALARAYGLDVPDDRKIVVLDEPTAALPYEESEKLLGVITRARDRGTTHVLISHRLDEIERIADRALVLRDGRLVADFGRGEIRVDALVQAMLGDAARPVGPQASSRAHSPLLTAASAPVILEISHLYGERVHDVSAEFRTGEIVGIGGSVGSGKSELVRLITGESRPRHGTIRVDGSPVGFRDPAAALRAGIAQVPQDRRGKGVLLDDTVRANLTLGVQVASGSLLPRRHTPTATTSELITRLRIRPPDPDHVVGLLSGGNQQKVALGRVLALAPRILVLDEPTQGIDIGARAEISALLKDIATSGTTIIVASTDTDELVELCDRVLILRAGRHSRTLRAPLHRTDISEAIGGGLSATDTGNLAASHQQGAPL